MSEHGTQSELSPESLGRILIVLNLRLLGIGVFEKDQKKKEVSSAFLISCLLSIKYP